MFKVLCINDNWQPIPVGADGPLPVFGETYNVRATTTIWNVRFHRLWEIDYGYAFMASHFAILPDATAEELQQLEEMIEPELVKG